MKRYIYEAVYQDQYSNTQIIIEDNANTLEWFKVSAKGILKDIVKDPNDFELIEITKLRRIK